MLILLILSVHSWKWKRKNINNSHTISSCPAVLLAYKMRQGVEHRTTPKLKLSFSILLTAQWDGSMYNTKLCIAQLTDPTEPIHFVYWKCTSSPGYHPTENRSCRKDGMEWICALRRFSFYFINLFLFTILWKLRLDQQNAHSKWLFSCMCLKCFALEQSLHISWHSTAYSAAYFKHWELFKVNFKKHWSKTREMGL